MDTKGRRLAENDDVSATNRNARVIHVAAAPGTYRAVVTSFQQRGDGRPRDRQQDEQARHGVLERCESPWMRDDRRPGGQRGAGLPRSVIPGNGPAGVAAGKNVAGICTAVAAARRV